MGHRYHDMESVLPTNPAPPVQATMRTLFTWPHTGATFKLNHFHEIMLLLSRCLSLPRYHRANLEGMSSEQDAFIWSRLAMYARQLDTLTDDLKRYWFKLESLDNLTHDRENKQCRCPRTWPLGPRGNMDRSRWLEQMSRVEGWFGEFQEDARPDALSEDSEQDEYEYDESHAGSDMDDEERIVGARATDEEDGGAALDAGNRNHSA